MKKKIMVLFLSSLLFAGCGSTAAPAAESKTESSSAASTVSEASSEVQETEAASSSSAAEEAVSAASESLETVSAASEGTEELLASSSSEGETEEVSFETVMSDIQAGIQPGTAGAGLKAAKAAAEFMDFCYTTDMTAEVLAAGAQAFNQNADDPEMLQEQIDVLADTIQSFKDGSGEGALTDSGTESSYPWDDAAYEKADAVLRVFAQK